MASIILTESQLTKLYDRPSSRTVREEGDWIITESTYIFKKPLSEAVNDGRLVTDASDLALVKPGDWFNTTNRTGAELWKQLKKWHPHVEAAEKLSNLFKTSKNMSGVINTNALSAPTRMFFKESYYFSVKLRLHKNNHLGERTDVIEVPGQIRISNHKANLNVFSNHTPETMLNGIPMKFGISIVYDDGSSNHASTAVGDASIVHVFEYKSRTLSDIDLTNLARSIIDVGYGKTIDPKIFIDRTNSSSPMFAKPLSEREIADMRAEFEAREKKKAEEKQKEIEKQERLSKELPADMPEDATPTIVIVGRVKDAAKHLVFADFDGTKALCKEMNQYNRQQKKERQNLMYFPYDEKSGTLGDMPDGYYVFIKKNVIVGLAVVNGRSKKMAFENKTYQLGGHV